MQKIILICCHTQDKCHLQVFIQKFSQQINIADPIVSIYKLDIQLCILSTVFSSRFLINPRAKTINLIDADGIKTSFLKFVG